MPYGGGRDHFQNKTWTIGKGLPQWRAFPETAHVCPGTQPTAGAAETSTVKAEENTGMVTGQERLLLWEGQGTGCREIPSFTVKLLQGHGT